MNGLKDLSLHFLHFVGTYLRRNTVLKELWLAHNDLTSEDAYTIGIVLKANLFLQFLDISNNNIEVSKLQSVKSFFDTLWCSHFQQTFY